MDEAMQKSNGSPRDEIVLVHGIATPRWAMLPLQWGLSRHGFDVTLWTYPSFFQSIEVHAANLRRFAMSRTPPPSKFHFVAHSMGCIVVRCATYGAPIPGLGRMVWIAPPNLGSPVARIVSTILPGCFPPADQLSSRPDSWVRALPLPEGQDIGILSARFDGLVPSRYTSLPGVPSKCLETATHNTLLISAKAIAETVSFLRTGAFRPS
jgi:triacylglycerol lipase